MEKVQCQTCFDWFATDQGMKIHHAKIHGVTLPRGVRIRAGRKHANKIVNLTSERVYEFADCRDLLAAQMGVKPETLSAQKVVSAAMQTMKAYVAAGGTLGVEWNVNRSPEC